MAQGNRFAFGILALLLFGQARAAVVEWRAEFPTVAGGESPMFHYAMQTGNGDFLVKGGTKQEQFLMRLDANGKTRWLNRTPQLGTWEYLSSPATVFETANGVVAFWKVANDTMSPTVGVLYAVRYDNQGKVALRVNLGEEGVLSSGSYGLDTRGDVLMLIPEDTLLMAAKRSLSGGMDWKVPLASGGEKEPLGFQELEGGRYLFASSQIGGIAGDTLRLNVLGAAGTLVWEAAIPTGPKTAGMAGYRDIFWTRLAHAEGGRIVVAGIATSPESGSEGWLDTLALAVVEATGSPAWMKRFPIARSGFGGSWSLDTVTVNPSGKIGVRVRADSLSIDFEFSGSGTRIAAVESALPNYHTLSQWGMRRLRDGKYAAYGYSEELLAHAPPVIDTHRVATSIRYPALFLAEAARPEWKTVRLDEYSDTVYYYSIPLRGDQVGPQIRNTGGQEIRFLLPTADGGVLVGGSLWDAGSRDKIELAALKIAPGFAVGIAPGRKSFRVPSPGAGNGIRFDLLGRPASGKKPPPGILLRR